MSRQLLRAVCSVAAILTATLVFGHAVVQDASLDDAPVRPDTPTTVTLRFNGAIEEAFTRVTLVTEGGSQQPLDLEPNAHPATVRVRLPALAAGSYGLRYRVLAVDGHVTESVLRFTVTPAR